MRNAPEQPVNRNLPTPPALPADFEQDLQSMDERLSNAARMSMIPAGLSDRVLSASIDMLREQQSQRGLVETNPSRLRLVGAGAMRLHRTGWGQFAMAASLAIICCVAIRFHTNPRSGGAILVANDVSPLLAQFDQLPHESAGDLDKQWSYLLDTNDVTSPDQITADIYAMVGQLGL